MKTQSSISVSMVLLLLLTLTTGTTGITGQITSSGADSMTSEYQTVFNERSDQTLHQVDITITATTSIVADIVQQVAGNLLEVDIIIPLGVDPHDFEPTPSDLSTINSSDHIFWIGGGAEESLEDLLEAREDSGTATSLLEAISNPIESSEEHEEAGDDHHGQYDPHFWMDPTLVLEVISTIESTLVSILPDQSSTITTNAANYIAELQDLHQDIVELVNQVDIERRFLVTQHASFAYFGRQYNFTLKSLQGISTDAETGIQEIDALANYLVENDIEVVFTESTVASDNMESVLESARSQGHGVAVGGQLFAGSLSSDGVASNYTSMMAYNAETIVSNILNPPEASAGLLPLDLTWLLALVVIPVIRRRND